MLLLRVRVRVCVVCVCVPFVHTCGRGFVRAWRRVIVSCVVMCGDACPYASCVCMQASADDAIGTAALRAALTKLVDAGQATLDKAKEARARFGSGAKVPPPAMSEETVAALAEVRAAIEEQETLIQGFQKENERLMTQLRKCVSIVCVFMGCVLLRCSTALFGGGGWHCSRVAWWQI